MNLDDVVDPGNVPNSTGLNLNNFSMSSSDGQANVEEGSSDTLFLVLWTVTAFVFIVLPCCGTQRRRQLCLRRIRELRWIDDDEDDEWYRAAIQRQQARRQQLEDEQRRFQTSKTLEDEARETYLLQLMEKYTLSLSKSDIHEADFKLVRSLSQGSMDGSQRSAKRGPRIGFDLEEDPEATIVDDVESNRAMNQQTKTRSVSVDDNDVDEDNKMEIVDFQDTNEVVHIPLPGQKKDSEVSTRRFMPNGCAICLSTFFPEEKVTWSSNPTCMHVFHHTCLLHWFHAVGRKAQKKRQRLNPGMSESAILTSICKFPKDCPCCRQVFCVEEEQENERNVESDVDAGSSPAERENNPEASV